ncbi:HEL167Cp [Eremothecium sinecaudum]|uniref:HEL167Cp n=1 Tax=Eremothecium sinecaudum TaxID=45286 RepID=A0A0X8HTE7_9SACH|nr:HEL167Cp [Eremothecium sinecaudum]AMD21114.1 HEL167Cp [Eremothecium sinecaudum]
MNSIPEKVNISHAMPSSMINVMREDIKQFQQTKELDQQQMDKVDHYIDHLDSIFAQFCKDNEHVEKKTAGVTDADVQLFQGLKKMYSNYMNQLSDIKKRKVEEDQEFHADKPLEYILDELPYLQPAERNRYISTLLKEKVSFSKDMKLFDGIANLCLLDGSVKDYLRTYKYLLQSVGFTQEEILSRIPFLADDYRPSEAAKRESTPDTPLSSDALSQDASNDSTNTNSTASTAISSTSTSSNSESNERPDEDRKKKISFSKYLKKDASEPVKRAMSPDDLAQPIVKRQKFDWPVSIIKDDKKVKKQRSIIRFVDDSKLVTVFGDDLPDTGVITSPDRLKKILNPYVEGEPREFILESWKNQKARKLIIDVGIIDDSDIAESRNGPVAITSKVPPSYRLNFTKFSDELAKSHRSPAEVEEDEHDLKNHKGKQRGGKGPIIVRAFGRNALLLKKDRGGLPYKKVPEVRKNLYPTRPDDDYT